MRTHQILIFFACYAVHVAICDTATENLLAAFEKAGWIEDETTTKNRIGSFIEPSVFEHHNYDQLTNFLYKYSQRYPNLAYLYSIGKSVQGRELPVITISRNARYENPGIPDVKYVANMHGNEVTGRELLLNLVEVLLVNYGRNDFLTRLVNTTSIHIMPTMNPDGYEVAHEGDAQGVTGRRNAQMVDLNRDFPSRYESRQSRSQPETLAVMNWTRTIPFVLSANLHDGSSVVNYPYDDGTMDRTVARTPDHELFVRLAYSYARAHSYMWKKGPRCVADIMGDPTLGVTNGAEWYPVSGGMQDWNYINTDCFEVTVEMNCQKFSYAKDLPRLWNANKFALLSYINQVHKSLNGFVRDAYTGRGIENAEIQVHGAGKIVHSHKQGAYHRLLNPGTYQVTFAHPNYTPLVKQFSITAQVPYKRMNVVLVPRTNSYNNYNYNNRAMRWNRNGRNSS